MYETKESTQNVLNVKDETQKQTNSFADINRNCVLNVLQRT